MGESNTKLVRVDERGAAVGGEDREAVAGVVGGREESSELERVDVGGTSEDGDRRRGSPRGIRAEMEGRIRGGDRTAGDGHRSIYQDSGLSSKATTFY